MTVCLAEFARMKKSFNFFSPWGGSRPPDPPFKSAWWPPWLIACLLAVLLAGLLAGWLAGLPAGWLAGLLAGWLAGWLAGCLAGWQGQISSKTKIELFSCSVENGFLGNSFSAFHDNSPERRERIPKEFVSRRPGDFNFRHVAYPGHLQNWTSVERRKRISKEFVFGIHGSWCRIQRVQKIRYVDFEMA